LQANSHWMETSGKVMQVAIHLARIPANKAMLRSQARYHTRPRQRGS
jgi:hypothetical protein